MTRYIYNGNARLGFGEVYDLTTIICLHQTPFGIQIKEIGHSKPPAGLSRRFISDEFVIHFVTEGSCLFCGESVDNTKGFLIVPGQSVDLSATGEDGWEHYWFRLSGSFARELLDSLGMEPTENHVFPCDWFGRFVPECNQVLHEELKDVDISVWMLGLFYRVMSRYSICTPKANLTKAEQYLTAAKIFVEQHFFDPITVDDIARSANITSKYLYRIFTDKIGKSPKEYLISYRLNRAREYLHGTQFSVTEIAHMVGYEDANYFSLTFHRVYGMAPMEYRRAHTFPKQQD